MARHRARQFAGMALLMAGCAVALAADDVRSERISFAAGESGATVSGTIAGYETVDYLVDARAGQSMTVTFETENTANYFNVIPPDEDTVAVFNGSIEGNEFAGMLDLDGDWKLRVYQMRSAARRNEVAQFRLNVAVTGLPDAAKSRVANDFGPREWDARGNLGCAFGGQPMQTAACPFKVIRYSDEPGGTVFVMAPNTSETRILYFTDGEWSTDSSEVIDVSRRDDLTSLTVGDEAYEIPDAVLFGG